MAALITRDGPLAVRTTKRVLVESPSWPPDDEWERRQEALRMVVSSADATEGATAFAERRAPPAAGPSMINVPVDLSATPW